MSGVLEQLAFYPSLYIPIFGIVGLMIGSFLNVVIYRLPKMLEAEWRAAAREYLAMDEETPERFNLAVPCSACPSCKRSIRPWENIPVLSYVALRGKCGGCSMRISVRYPLVELLGAGAGLLAGWQFGLSLEALAMASVFWTLIALALIDHDTMMLPDSLCLPLLWAGLVFVAIVAPDQLAAHVIGAATGYLAFRVLPIGEGDAKLAAACGAWLGWAALPFFVSVGAGISCLMWVLLYFRNKASRQYPFGPALAVAFVLAVFYGKPYAHYLGLI
ncbi:MULTISPECIES: prepilin peptidase [Pseudomonas]|uniref:Prepilin peptidase n=1 Tax=Pseudomonas fluorescens TaxID=294 RepID=A0A162B2H7_PSEFL|nr:MULTISPECIES: A24 family peptidase [Pseudomonas]KZN20686.1 hypothetical protein A1D17_03865 [Pseudomonas fluorescens]